MKVRVKRKRRKPKLTALRERIIDLAIDILSGIISGLTIEAILKALDK